MSPKSSKSPQPKQEPVSNAAAESPPHLRDVTPNTSTLPEPKHEPKRNVVAKSDPGHVQSLGNNKAVTCDKATTRDKADMGSSLDVKAKGPASSPIIAVASNNSNTSTIIPEKTLADAKGNTSH
jgi:hypothetical protein